MELVEIAHAADLAIGNKLTNRDFPGVEFSVVELDNLHVTLQNGQNSRQQSFYLLEFEQRAFRKVPPPVVKKVSL